MPSLVDDRCVEQSEVSARCQCPNARPLPKDVAALHVVEERVLFDVRRLLHSAEPVSRPRPRERLVDGFKDFVDSVCRFRRFARECPQRCPLEVEAERVERLVEREGRVVRLSVAPLHELHEVVLERNDRRNFAELEVVRHVEKGDHVVREAVELAGEVRDRLCDVREDVDVLLHEDAQNGVVKETDDVAVVSVELQRRIAGVGVEL